MHLNFENIKKVGQGIARPFVRLFLWLRPGLFVTLTWISWLLLIVTIGLLVFGIVKIINDEPIAPWFSSTVQTLHIGNDSWDWIAVSIACISLFYGCITFNSQHQTEKNTMKITPESQRQILIDYIRHYYRNLVIICAVESKLGNRFDEYYPSEEHLLKLKVELDDLHPAAFYNHSDKYKAIHKLLTLMRNFNTEIDVATSHICDRNVWKEAKKRDFATLKFKMGLLAENTFDTINAIWPKTLENNFKEVKSTLTDALGRDYNKIELPEAIEKMKNVENKMPYFKNEKTFFTKTIFSSKDEIEQFLFKLNCNIYAEIHAKNSNGFDNSEKIFLIPFNKE